MLFNSLNRELNYYGLWLGFLGVLRLQDDHACFAAYGYNIKTRVTTGIILQTSADEVKAIQDKLIHYKRFLGQELLLRSVITEISLDHCAELLIGAKQAVIDIEDATGEHTWAEYTATSKETRTDSELSKDAHGVKIEIALIRRRIEVISYWGDQLLEKCAEMVDTTSSAPATIGNREEMLQWIKNMKSRVKMVVLDTEYLETRATNQVGAVSIFKIFAPYLPTT